MKICSLRNENLQFTKWQFTFSLHLLGYSKQKIPPKKAVSPRKFRLPGMHDVFIAHIKFNLSSGAQVKPCRGLRTGWVSNREYRLKGPYIVLSFLLLLFCVLCGVIVNSVLKSRFSIISASGFRKRKKQRTNMARCSSPENYYSSGRNTELKLCRLWSIYRRGNQQTKKSGFLTV